MFSQAIGCRRLILQYTSTLSAMETKCNLYFQGRWQCHKANTLKSLNLANFGCYTGCCHIVEFGMYTSIINYWG